MITFSKFQRQVEESYPNQEKTFQNSTAIDASEFGDILYSSTIKHKDRPGWEDSTSVHFLVSGDWMIVGWNVERPGRTASGHGDSLAEAQKEFQKDSH